MLQNKLHSPVCKVCQICQQDFIYRAILSEDLEICLQKWPKYLKSVSNNYM